MTRVCYHVGDVACRGHVLRFDMTFFMRRGAGPQHERLPGNW